MGESGGRAGDPTEPRGVGGIKAITGRISFVISRSEEDDPSVVLNLFDQLVARSRALTRWKPYCSGWSMLKTHGLRSCTSNLVVFV